MSHYDCPCMEKCPLHYAMSLIGGKWKVQILCSVTNAGTIRYNALRGKLDGISNTVLSSALRELERDGLILRREYLEVPVRVCPPMNPQRKRRNRNDHPRSTGKAARL